jgi:hypothetical protein
MHLQNTYLNNQKKNQKLFEDDDSEDGQPMPMPKEEKEDNRSNLVKKMFYKDSS